MDSPTDKTEAITPQELSLSDVKLNAKEKVFLIVFILAYCIYTAMVAVLLFVFPFNSSTKILIVFSYAAIAPVALYLAWFLFSYKKLTKWSQKGNFLGGNLTYLILFFLLGICVITWAKYWNTGIDPFWLGAAILYFLGTNDENGFLWFYYVGSTAITPALVEEFLKSFPSIIAFFVVLQRKRNPRQKGKGMFGNEFYGMTVGIMIGIAFEILELILYLIATIYSNGTILDVFFQVTLRNCVPIHILGGAIGGYAAGRAERIRFEKGEENLSIPKQTSRFIKRFLPYWAIPVLFHFSWNFLQVAFVLIAISSNSISEAMYIGFDIATMIIFSAVSLIVLIVFFKRANNAAIRDYRCPNTGIFVLDKDVKCEPIPDSEVSSQSPEQRVRFCFNCGTELLFGYRFCTNCGADNAVVDYMKMQQNINHQSFTRAFIILSMIFGIIFALASLLFNFVLLIIDAQVLPSFLFNLLTDLVGAFSIILSAFYLLRNRKHYSGKKSVWCWLFLIFNYIGMTFTCIILGFGLVVSGYVYTYLGLEGSMLLPIIGFVLAVFGFILLLFLILFLAEHGGKSLLHYQATYA